MLLLQASTFTIGILVMAHTTITPTVAVVSRLIPILVLGHILSCCLVTITLVFTLLPVMSWWLALVLWRLTFRFLLPILLPGPCLLLLVALSRSMQQWLTVAVLP